MKYMFSNFRTRPFRVYSILFLSLILNRQWSLVSASDEDDENIDPRKDPMLGSQFADNVKAYLYTVGNDDPKEFSWKDPAELSSVGFKKGERYRWLFHDWCGSKSDMLPLAIAYKQSNPQENIILIDFSNPKPATFDEMKSLVKNYAVQSLYFLYGIFDAIDVSESATDVRSNSHGIGFGFGALIASWFGAAAGQRSRNLVNQLGYPFKSDGKPYVFTLSRLTSIDPIGMCIYTEEKNSPACADVTKWPIISQSNTHSKFTDAVYTSKASIPTICPAEAGAKRIAHHRGVYLNEGLRGDLTVAFLQPGCSAESFSSTRTLCTDLAASCSHGRGISLYADVIFILGLRHLNCDQVVGPIFGDRDPNNGDESILANNFHIESDALHPFSRSWQCSEREGDLPDYNGRYPECRQQQVEIQHVAQWEVEAGSRVGTTAPPRKPGELETDFSWENNKNKNKQSKTEISPEQGNKNEKPGPNEAEYDVAWENNKNKNKQTNTVVNTEETNKLKEPNKPQANEMEMDGHVENSKTETKQTKTEITKEETTNDQRKTNGPNEKKSEINFVDFNRENRENGTKQTKTGIIKEETNNNQQKPSGQNENEMEIDYNVENQKTGSKQTKTEITKEETNNNLNGPKENEMEMDVDMENNKSKTKQTQTVVERETNLEKPPSNTNSKPVEDGEANENPKTFQGAKSEMLNSGSGSAKKTRNQRVNQESQLETFDGGFRKQEKREEVQSVKSSAVEYRRPNRGRRNIANRRRRILEPNIPAIS